MQATPGFRPGPGFINDDRIVYLDDKYQVDPRALERAEQAREDLEVTKEQFRGELESYGPKGPSWDYVAFYEELCQRFLKGRIEEQYVAWGLLT